MKTLRDTEDIACTCIRQVFTFTNMVLTKTEYSRALNASYTVQPLKSFWFLFRTVVGDGFNFWQPELVIFREN